MSNNILQKEESCKPEKVHLHFNMPLLKQNVDCHWQLTAISVIELVQKTNEPLSFGPKPSSHVSENLRFSEH